MAQKAAGVIIAVVSGAAAMRTSSVAGWIVSEQRELRLEFQRCETFMSRCGLMQVAFAF